MRFKDRVLRLATHLLLFPLKNGQSKHAACCTSLRLAERVAIIMPEPIGETLMTELSRITHSEQSEHLAGKEEIVDSVRHYVSELESAAEYLANLAFRHDVVLAAGSDVFPALKTVLIQESPYFRGLFSTRARKHVICLTDLRMTDLASQMNIWPDASKVEVVFFPDTDPEVLRMLVMMLFSADACADSCSSDFLKNSTTWVANLQVCVGSG